MTLLLATSCSRELSSVLISPRLLLPWLLPLQRNLISGAAFVSRRLFTINNDNDDELSCDKTRTYTMS